MTPRQYLDLVVKPNLQAFAEDVSDPRLAYNAITTADALAAHLYYWCRNNAPAEVSGLSDDTAYRRHIEANKANVGLVHDVAKALKHVEMNSKTNKIKTAAEVQARSFGWGEGAYGAGPWGGGPQVSVIVGGSKIQLHSSVATAVEFYEREMDRLGV